jgi:hypothetical protein
MNGNPSDRSRDLELLHAPDLVELRIVEHEQLLDELSSSVDGQVGDVGHAHLSELVEQLLYVRVWFGCHECSWYVLHDA